MMARHSKFIVIKVPKNFQFFRFLFQFKAFFRLLIYQLGFSKFSFFLGNSGILILAWPLLSRLGVSFQKVFQLFDFKNSYAFLNVLRFSSAPRTCARSSLGRCLVLVYSCPPASAKLVTVLPKYKKHHRDPAYPVVIPAAQVKSSYEVLFLFTF